MGGSSKIISYLHDLLHHVHSQTKYGPTRSCILYTSRQGFLHSSCPPRRKKVISYMTVHLSLPIKSLPYNLSLVELCYGKCPTSLKCWLGARPVQIDNQSHTSHRQENRYFGFFQWPLRLEYKFCNEATLVN